MVSWHRHSIESLDGVDMDSADRSLKRAAMADIAAVEILLRLWDPIGVKPGIFAPVDEYNSYAPHIVSMVKGGCTFEELVAHLEHLSSVTMGIGSATPQSKSRRRDIAEKIVETILSSNYRLERP